MSDIQELLAKDPEKITPDDRKALVEHLRAERVRFEAAEQAGKSVRGLNKKPIDKDNPPVTEDDPWKVKVFK